MSDEMTSRLTPRSYVDSVIRVGIIALLAFACFRVFSPFLAIMVWALMLAIMLYPLHQRFSRRLGGRQGLTATLMVLAVFVLLGPPLVLVSGSIVEDVVGLKNAFESGELETPPPNPSVQDWPFIGERVFAAWSQAATDLPEFLETHASQLKAVARYALSGARQAIGAVFFFLFAFVIAGFMVTFGKQGSGAMRRIFGRIAGREHGDELQTLVVATVRSVASGVLGVAFIQALLFGIGFVLAHVPAAAGLALIVMFVGILQLPAMIVALPVIIYLWAGTDASTGANIFFTIYFLIAGLADNVLKPMLLGRGVEAPMPVILLGAIGGMVTSGLIGLFLGAAVLAVGYQIFMGWSHGSDEDPLALDSTSE